MKHMPALRRDPGPDPSRLKTDGAVVDDDDLRGGRAAFVLELDGGGLDRVGPQDHPGQPEDQGAGVPDLAEAKGHEGVEHDCHHADVEERQCALESAHVGQKHEPPPRAPLAPLGLVGGGVAAVDHHEAHGHEQKHRRGHAAHDEHEDMVVGVVAQRARFDLEAAGKEGDVAVERVFI